MAQFGGRQTHSLSAALAPHELQRSPRGDLVPEPKQAKLLI